jgi:hypothetical protein
MRCTEDIAVFVRMREDFVAETEHAFVDRAPARQRFALQRFERDLQIVEAADQQIVLAVEVRVERGATDVRAVDDLLDGQGFEALLPDERQQRAANELLRPLDASIPLFHHRVGPADDLSC